MLFVLLPIFIQLTSVLYTQVLRIWIPFGMYPVIIPNLQYLCNENFLTFIDVQYKGGHQEVQLRTEQREIVTGRNKIRTFLLRKTQKLPKSSDRQILVGDAGALALQKFSYTHTHTYGIHFHVRSWSDSFKLLTCPSSRYFHLQSVSQMCDFDIKK